MGLKKWLPVAVALALPVFAPTLEATTIETVPHRPEWGDWGIGVVGFDPNFGTERFIFGQTFTVPVLDTRLSRFSLWLQNGTSETELLFSGYLMRWDSDRATGEILYRSGPQRTRGAPLSRNRYDFRPGALNLDPRATYIFFLSSTEYLHRLDPPRSLAALEMVHAETDQYPGGSVAYFDRSLYGRNLTLEEIGAGTHPWLEFPFQDARFSAEFSHTTAVPEPLSAILFGTGLAGVAVLRRRRANRSRGPEDEA